VTTDSELNTELERTRQALEAWRNFSACHETVRDLLQQEVKRRHGVPSDWVEVLVRINDQPGSATRMHDLAAGMLHSKSGMTRLVDRMEAAGLVSRSDDPSDRRAVLVTLTKRGRRLLEEVLPTLVQVLVERFAAHISPEEARFLGVAMARVIEANERLQQTDATPGAAAGRKTG
jgi:DNA-binding MarR family transcriptional regulator